MPLGVGTTCPGWTSRVDGASHLDDRPAAAALALGGSKLVVAGVTDGGATREDYLVLSIDASTGLTDWIRSYDTPDHNDDQARAVAVSPDGGTVFVTGGSFGTQTDIFFDYATIAYDAATGDERWRDVHAERSVTVDDGMAAAVSPDGQVLVVGGSAYGACTPHPDGWDCGDLAARGYDAVTGGVLWDWHQDGPLGGADFVRDVVIDPASQTVYVAGTNYAHGGSDNAMVVHALDLRSGTDRWTYRFWGGPESHEDAVGLAQTPEGSFVFLTGLSQSPTTEFDMLTVALDAGLGGPIWTHTYDGPGHGWDVPTGLAASASCVMVTGYSRGLETSGRDAATFCLRPNDGAPVWVVREEGLLGSQEISWDLAYDTVRDVAYVTGWRTVVESPVPSLVDSPLPDLITVAYDGKTGTKLWSSQWGHLTEASELGLVAVPRSTGGVHAVGVIQPAGQDSDVLVVSYGS